MMCDTTMEPDYSSYHNFYQFPNPQLEKPMFLLFSKFRNLLRGYIYPKPTILHTILSNSKNTTLLLALIHPGTSFLYICLIMLETFQLLMKDFLLELSNLESVWLNLWNLPVFAGHFITFCYIEIDRFPSFSKVLWLRQPRNVN